MESSFSISRPHEQLKRRRNRSTKSCQPCRDRKVRCDLKVPCSTCKRRDHIHLCQYGSEATIPDQTTSRSNHKASTSRVQQFIVYVPGNASSSALPSSKEAQSSVHDLDRLPAPPNAVVEQEASAHPSPVDAAPEEAEQAIAAFPRTSSPRDVFVETSLPSELIPLLNNIAYNLSERRNTNSLTSETIYLGRNSSAVFFQGLASIYLKELLPDDVSLESAFALNNRTTLHPFGSLWATYNVKIGDVLQALPNPEVCMRYYRSYLSTVTPFYPFLLDPEDFEHRLVQLLELFGDEGIDTSSTQFSRDATFEEAAWYGLLFAVLGLGCQFSDTNGKDRVLRTRVFVVCAFECLRLANLYVRPTVEVIQCMLLLEMTIANDCNPGVVYGLLGLTVQQAQSLGLHLKQGSTISGQTSQDPVHPLWRSIMFLDSVLSTAYDRRPVSFLPVGYCIFTDPSNATASSFNGRMSAIHALKLAWQKTSAEGPAAITKIQAIEPYINALEEIDKLAEVSMNASETQASIQGRLEHLVYKLYTCCFRSKLARSACLSRCPSDSHRRIFFESMTFNLKEVINAFLALKQLSPVASISWDILQPTMTSALVLSGVEIVLGAGDSRELLRKLIRSLSASSEDIDSEAADMTVAPYCHGLETLQYSVDKLAYHPSEGMAS